MKILHGSHRASYSWDGCHTKGGFGVGRRQLSSRVSSWPWREEKSPNMWNLDMICNIVNAILMFSIMIYHWILTSWDIMLCEMDSPFNPQNVIWMVPRCSSTWSSKDSFIPWWYEYTMKTWSCWFNISSKQSQFTSKAAVYCWNDCVDDMCSVLWMV